LGVAQYRAGDWSAAAQSLEKSIEICHGGDAFAWYFAAMTNIQLGRKDQARNWYDRAVKWTDKNAPADEELSRFRSEAAELVGAAGRKRESIGSRNPESQ
jgi:Tfp pilus assembly protein PilF